MDDFCGKDKHCMCQTAAQAEENPKDERVL